MATTFQGRLDGAMGERGYTPHMRRSVQTVILYEAHRCLKDKLPSLKPFQRKLAVYDQANHLLLESSLLPYQREEVLYKTASSRESLNPESLWRRLKKVPKEVGRVAEQVRPLITSSKTHLECYHAFLQKTYVRCRLSVYHDVCKCLFVCFTVLYCIEWYCIVPVPSI
jgi:hypothetical protein